MCALDHVCIVWSDKPEALGRQPSYIAAFRMKGVVSPQHAPTIRKPRIQRKMDGWGSLAMGASGSMAMSQRLFSLSYGDNGWWMLL